MINIRNLLENINAVMAESEIELGEPEFGLATTQPKKRLATPEEAYEYVNQNHWQLSEFQNWAMKVGEKAFLQGKRSATLSPIENVAEASHEDIATYITHPLDKKFNGIIDNILNSMIPHEPGVGYGVQQIIGGLKHKLGLSWEQIKELYILTHKAAKEEIERRKASDVVSPYKDSFTGYIAQMGNNETEAKVANLVQGMKSNLLKKIQNSPLFFQEKQD